MKIFGIRIAGVLTACLLGLVTQAQPGLLMAQATDPLAGQGIEPPAEQTAAPTASMAKIHGHVNDPLGTPLMKGEVRLTTDKNAATSKKFEYTFPIDMSGNYIGTGVKPANYVAAVFQDDSPVDFMPAPLLAGEDKTVDFDMSRKAYIDKMSPAEKDAMEQLKKQNAETMATNAKIDNLNAMLKQARLDTQAGKFASAIKAMTDATTAKADNDYLWDALGDAQLGDAVAADNAAKANHTADASVPGKLTEAVNSYQKALSLNAALEKPDASFTAIVNNQLGQAFGRMGKPKDASDAYDAAAKADPKGAAKYYYNEAVTLYNASLSSGKVDGIVEAADKTIAADPTKADAYYLKTQGLAPLITQTPDGKSFVAPPGLVEACNKYLELAPSGVHAQDMKDLLAGLQQQIQTNYKAPPAPKKK
jgi:tetratricopeptide (TPR) repeat protein